jgi:Uma2 family endonuclease
MLIIDRKKKTKIKKIPPHLIYEEMNGIALPYKGFRDVLAGKKKVEEIIGNSSLKSVFVFLMNGYIGSNINRKKYAVGTNEAGLHIGEGDNLTNDIVIFEKENLVLDDKYFKKAPKVVVEVDIKIDLSTTEWTNEWDYVIEKSQKMLDFGTERVIWITTKSKKVFVSSKTERWYMVDFNEDIELIDGVVLNIAQILKDEELMF